MQTAEIIMNATHHRVSHLVRVARIRVETAVVQIEGDDRDDGEAEREAIEKAASLPDHVWVMQPFDESAYRPHVQSMISREEIAELTQEGRSADAELTDLGEAIRYQLLKANCDTGEGELALQPWLEVDEPDLLASDLCRGWIDALQDLGVTHLSERLDDLTAGSPPMPSDLVLFNVKRRSPPKE